MESLSYRDTLKIGVNAAYNTGYKFAIENNLDNKEEIALKNAEVAVTNIFDGNYKGFTRNENIRNQIESMGLNAIIYLLLENAILYNAAFYSKKATYLNTDLDKKDMSFDEITVKLANISINDPGDAFEILKSNKEFFKALSYTFVNAVLKDELRESIEAHLSTEPNQLDTYFERMAKGGR